MNGRRPFSRHIRPGNAFTDNRTAVLYALLSAILFGVSTPVAKFLVGSIKPVTLAGLLYCGLVSALPGGGVGPLLLIFGLARTDAPTASLLLTLEGAATALMAWFIFHENFDRHIAIGMTSLMAAVAPRCPIGGLGFRPI